MDSRYSIQSPVIKSFRCGGEFGRCDCDHDIVIWPRVHPTRMPRLPRIVYRGVAKTRVVRLKEAA